MHIILIVSILFLSPFLSGLSVLFLKKGNSNFLKLILSFSGAYLFGLTVLHLIPDVYGHAGSSGGTIGLYILGGFLFQLLLEHFSQGVEHGHLHVEKDAIGSFPIAILVSLCLHAFLEGMPLISTERSHLVFGIAIHHIPAAFALGTLLLAAGSSKTVLFISVLAFAIMTPAGFLTSRFLSENAVGNLALYFDKIMAVVIGIFLHVSTTILFESGSPDHHVFNKKKMVAVLLGIILSLSSLLFGGHSHAGHDHDHEHTTSEQHIH
ncbi:ZIP family metal transporter [Sphingobacterium sp. BIGb0165]|uniref:ZIP family metal transporter n=1 Tax=Sphingobacterium sp. BIGb0165 TaxID=2940615 RepID=UPI002169F73B|nr:ZIP family metal transporter [Sphingobacterium sp. BIGb0165]MCS4226475.1 zinc transporter ZupT [Sphingobacterium sp. BIGb0165]